MFSFVSVVSRVLLIFSPFRVLYLKGERNPDERMLLYDPHVWASSSPLRVCSFSRVSMEILSLTWYRSLEVIFAYYILLFAVDCNNQIDWWWLPSVTDVLYPFTIISVVVSLPSSFGLYRFFTWLFCGVVSWFRVGDDSFGYWRLTSDLPFFMIVGWL